MEDGLWFKLWEMSIKYKKWRVVTTVYVNNRSCIVLECKCSEFFPIMQEVAHGHTLLPTLLLIYINVLYNVR